MSSPEDLAASIADGAHATLARMVGRWRGRARLWLEPGKLTADDTVEGEVVARHGGRFVQHDYATRIDGAEETGTALVGFDLDAGRWEMAWVDSWHNGTSIMYSRGPLMDARRVSVLGSYGASPGPLWGWRTTFEPGQDRLTVCHFNVTPDGDEALAVQFDYERASG